MVNSSIVIAGVLFAVAYDWKVRRIPNAITFPMIFSGFAVNGFLTGAAGIAESGLGCALGILLLYFPFVVGGVGGGDVKLVGAIGSLLGPLLVLKIFLASAVFGGILSTFALIRQKAFRRTIRSMRNKAVIFYLTRKWIPEESGKEEQQIKIPYACAIGCGTLFVLFVLKGGG